MSRHLLPRHSLAPAKLVLAAAMAVSAAWAQSASAQTSNTDDGGGPWSLGLGAVSIDKVYRDFDPEVLALPVVSYENRWVSAGLPVSDFKAWSGESLSFRARARFSTEGYEAEDSPFLAGMDERKPSVWVGGAVLWKTDFANISGEVLTDALGNSKGTRARVQVDRRFAAGRFGFAPRLAAEWVDDKYVDYYYGVKQAEVLASRAFHAGESTTNMQVGVRVDYTPARHHMVFLDAGATRVGSTIEDSPLVDRSNQTSLAVGYVHRF